MTDFVQTIRRACLERPALAEAVIAVTVFIGAAAWGTHYWYSSLEAGRQPSFYQEYFEPAVMTACGRGFTEAAPPVSAVEDFIRGRRDTLRCVEIPSDTRVKSAEFQRPWLYLMNAVALAWKLFGISWSGLGPLAGALCGAAVCAAYALFRLGSGRVLSLLLAATFAVSPLHLLQLPHIRDYAKAPFAIACLVLLGILISRRLSARALVLVSACFGAVVGIGYGFRADLLINIVPFVVCLAVGTADGITRRVVLRFGALMAFVIAFSISAWPLLKVGYQRGTCQGHFLLLGLTSGFTDNLGLAPGPYDFGNVFSDRWVSATLVSFAERDLPETGSIGFCTPDYDAVSAKYLSQLVRTFPADFATRTAGSIVAVIQQTFRVEPSLPSLTPRLYDLRARVARRLTNTSLWWVLAAVVLAAAYEVRLGLVLVGIVLFYCGYPAIQFHPRHFFHLEVITLWAVGFVLACVWARLRSTPPPIKFRQGLLVSASTLAGLALVLFALRQIQQSDVRHLFNGYLDAPKQPIDTESASPDGVHRVRFPEGQRYPHQFLEIDVNSARCNSTPAVVIRYEKRPDAELSRTVILKKASTPDATTRVFAPVYEFFQGLEFSDENCVAGVYRLPDSRSMPLWLNATLEPGWESGPLFQQFKDPLSKVIGFR